MPPTLKKKFIITTFGYIGYAHQVFFVIKSLSRNIGEVMQEKTNLGWAIKRAVKLFKLDYDFGVATLL